jgi:HAD superfamily hydrolase (TIGR01509 family)
MDGLIFDFDGVIVDSEPIHLAGFQQVLAGEGIQLTRQQYYRHYLGYDDHDCFVAILRDRGRQAGPEQVARMTARKTELVQRMLAQSIQPLPGARELILAAAGAGVAMAICSGALRAEIELAARTVGVWEHFQAIVSAQDVSAGKPDPQGCRLALDRLREATRRPLEAARCVVIEDAPAGIEAAKRAGMAVLAVATSYPPGQLAQADHVVHQLIEVDLPLLDHLAKA